MTARAEPVHALGRAKATLRGRRGAGIAESSAGGRFCCLSEGGPREGTRVGVLSAVQRGYGKCIRGWLARSRVSRLGMWPPVVGLVGSVTDESSVLVPCP